MSDHVTILGTVRIGSKRARSAGQPRLGESVISVDRTNPVLGNRHVLRNHLDDVERAKVIAAYEADLIADEQGTGGPMTRAIERIADRVKAGENVILMCWCAPERDCHARHIAVRVKRLVEQAEKPAL